MNAVDWAVLLVASAICVSSLALVLMAGLHVYPVGDDV